MHQHLRTLSQSSGTLLVSCSSSSRNHHLLQASPRRRLRPHCTSFTSICSPAQSLSAERHFKTNACRPWQQSFATKKSRALTSQRRHVVERPAEVIGDSESKSLTGSEEEDEEDFPLWMEEDDPSWPEDDPEGDGVGFRVSNFFEPRIENVPKEKSKNGAEDSESDSDDEIEMDWDAEQYEWIVREISSAEWEIVALQDPTPLVFLAFERYGPSGPNCWKLLEQLEEMLRTILDSRKYPVRAVKLDISSEPGMGDALKIKVLPSLLFINGGKLVYRLSGYKSAADLTAIASHLFYHSARPDCMDEVETSHSVVNINSSG